MKRLFCASMIFIAVLFFLDVKPLLAYENLTNLVKKIQPAVVTVIAYDAFGKPVKQGSGFFINSQGHFITNYHVVAGGVRLEVRTAEGENHPFVKVLASNEAWDLAVATLVLPPLEVKSLTMTTAKPEVGERIVVVGSPLGLEQSLSEGVVSAVRKIPNLGELVQITAPISPGSSGSPVVNLRGEVIGVATFFLARGQNLNFAVPALYIATLQRRAGEVARTAKLPSPAGRLAGEAGDGILQPPGKSGRPPMAKDSDEERSSAPNSASDYLLQGLKFWRAKEYAKAITSLQAAIRLEPDDAASYYWLGSCYRKLGRYREAAEAFKQAIRLRPDEADYYIGLGWAYEKWNRLPEAVAAYRQAVRCAPNNADGYYFLGGALGDLGLHREEIEAHKQAICLQPDHASAHFLLGLAYLRVNDRRMALEQYKILQTLDPKSAQSLFNCIYR